MCASASLPSCKHERGQSREHVSVCRNVLATQPNHSLAIVTGSPSGTTSSSGNIMPNIAACPLVCLSGRITQPWHARERSCVGAPACASTHASARAVTHSQRLFHTRIQPSHRCTSVAPGLVHPSPCPTAADFMYALCCARARALTHAISRAHTQPGTVKLTPPSPDTCYGAAVMIDMMLG